MIPLFMIITLFPFDWGTLAVAQSQIAVNQLIGAIIFAIASFTGLVGWLHRQKGWVGHQLREIC